MFAALNEPLARTIDNEREVFMNFTSMSSVPDEPSSRSGAAFVPKRYAHADGVYWGSPETSDALEPGFYEPGDSPRVGPVLRRMAMKTDNLLRLQDPICDLLLSEFVKFWQRAPEMSKRGLSVKRGLMLYGPPGSGKTSAVQLMAHHMIREMSGVVVMVEHPHVTAQCIQLMRTY